MTRGPISVDRREVPMLDEWRYTSSSVITLFWAWKSVMRRLPICSASEASSRVFMSARPVSMAAATVKVLNTEPIS